MFLMQQRDRGVHRKVRAGTCELLDLAQNPAGILHSSSRSSSSLPPFSLPFATAIVLVPGLSRQITVGFHLIFSPIPGSPPPSNKPVTPILSRNIRFGIEQWTAQTSRIYVGTIVGSMCLDGPGAAGNALCNLLGFEAPIIKHIPTESMLRRCRIGRHEANWRFGPRLVIITVPGRSNIMPPKVSTGQPFEIILWSLARWPVNRSYHVMLINHQEQIGCRVRSSSARNLMLNTPWCVLSTA